MSFRRRLVLLTAGAVAVAISLAAGATYLLVSSQLRGEVDRELRADAAGVLPARYTMAFRQLLGRDGRGGGAEAGSPGRLADRILIVGRAAGVPPERMPSRKQIKRLIERAPTALPPGLLGAGRDRGSTERRFHTTFEGGRVVLPSGPLGSSELYAQVIDAEGEVARPPGADGLPIPEEARAVASGRAEPYFYDAEVDGERFRVHVARLGAGQAVQVARPLTEVEDTLQRLAIVLALVALGGIGLAVGLGLVVARTALKPVARLTGAAEQIAETRDLAHRMEVSGDDELARLARSFNTMLAALEQSLDSQRQLVADASHELRTPLTSLKTNVEVLESAPELPPAERAALISGVIAQVDEVVALVGDLIELARDSEGQGVPEPLRLDELVEEVVERFRRRPGDVGIGLKARPCAIEGVPGGLERAVGNLIDNALKWSPPGAEVEVRVSERGMVTVRDHGPGIAPVDLPHVFERFYRADAAQGLPGSGLGLAIVRQVADNHGGSVRALRAPGGGAELRLDLGPCLRPAVLTRS